MEGLKLREEGTAALAKWKAESDSRHEELRLLVAVDIGATNTRVGIIPSATASNVGPAAFVTLCAFECDDAVLLAEGLKRAADAIAPITAAAAVIDAAGPVVDGGARVTITNWPESKDRNVMPAKLDKRICPVGKTQLLNDLEAACHGVVGLSGDGRLGEFFVPLYGATEVKQLAPTRHLVLAMGTGLGVGILLAGKGGKFEVVPTELGHTLVTQFGSEHPESAKDAAFVSWLGKRLWGGAHTAEFEDICSGRGLRASYEWVCLGVRSFDDGAVPSPKAIADMAAKGDELALRAMTLHYKFLLRCAQNVCVGMQTKGVILAGDNQVSNHWFVAPRAKALAEEFLWHPKQTAGKDRWLENTPVIAQNNSVNTNMIGCLVVARSLVC